MIGRGSARVIEKRPNPQGLLPLTGAQDRERRSKMRRALNDIEASNTAIEERSDQEKDGYYDLKLSLRKGGSSKLLTRLNVQPYRIKGIDHEVTQDGERKEYKEEIVYGRVSTKKLKGEQRSNFEKLKDEVEGYVEDNSLRSYYDVIGDISPITYDEIVDSKLRSDFEQADPSKRFLVDFIFGTDAESSEVKLSSLREEYSDKFILQINSQLNHYCRMFITRSEAEIITKQHKGIVEITYAPLFEPSEGQTLNSGDIEPVDLTDGSTNPVIVADEAIASEHPLLKDVVVDQLGNTTLKDNHGTQVGSLVVYGRKLPISGRAEQHNKIIGLTALIPTPDGKHQTLNDQLIKETVESYRSSNKPLVINLSINSPFVGYDRYSINNVTSLLDELSHKNNCLFVISAGNMNEINRFYEAGVQYPDYFNLDKTTILAPADSINNVTVGAITYQESSDSIAKLENPSPITRRGFEEKKFGFIKPDLVHYDSNCVLNGEGLVEPEYNGPNLATATTGITKNIGTSFAAPLVSHELGLLARQYPSYNAQTLKALLVHFAQVPSSLPTGMQPERATSLVGHGQTRIEDALNSLNTASTIVIEDTIKNQSTKTIKFPVPSLIAGSRNLRLRLRMTLSYSVPPNNLNISQYCPINLSATLRRTDDKTISNGTTQSYLGGAHKKSNIKKYPILEKNTLEHMGEFWYIDVNADPIGEFLSESYIQPYSIVLTIEDILKDDGIDIHQEISQMIEVETSTTIDIEV